MPDPYKIGGVVGARHASPDLSVDIIGKHPTFDESVHTTQASGHESGQP
jgi:hypothetical protein